MNASQIIMQNSARLGVDPNQAMAGIAKLVQQGKLTIVQDGNTVLLYKLLAKHVAKIQLFTVDQPLPFAKSASTLIGKLKNSGVVAVFAKTTDPQMAQVFKMLHLNQVPSDNPEFQLKAKL